MTYAVFRDWLLLGPISVICSHNQTWKGEWGLETLETIPFPHPPWDYILLSSIRSFSQRTAWLDWILCDSETFCASDLLSHQYNVSYDPLYHQIKTMCGLCALLLKAPLWPKTALASFANMFYFSCNNTFFTYFLSRFLFAFSISFPVCRPYLWRAVTTVCTWERAGNWCRRPLHIEVIWLGLKSECNKKDGFRSLSLDF